MRRLSLPLPVLLKGKTLFRHKESASRFVLPPFTADPAGLHQHQSQGPSSVLTALALAAAHWILQQ